MDGIVGLQLLVHLDEAARADLALASSRGRGFRSSACVRPRPARGRKLSLRALPSCAFERGADSAAFVFDRGDGGVEQDSVKHLFQPLVQREDQIAIRAGKQSGQHFDDRHVRAERGVDRAEFEADVSAADDQQGAGNVFEIQRAGGIHHARRVELQRGNDRRARAGGDDDAVEGERLFGAVGFRDPQRGGVLKRRAALHVLHLALLRENAEAAGELLDDAFFPRAQARQIDFRRGELDAPVLGLMRFFDQLGDVQQRLRRNAAAVEADAAGIQLPDR